jgi:hypothetical protein
MMAELLDAHRADSYEVESIHDRLMVELQGLQGLQGWPTARDSG